ncbi:hypothetical protein [Streptomyces sp. NPDC059597]|uniref:hypothetical protein n=1 Tax=Streptomyces sp. NPDC059597 TaxID=3346879 RepID=UPI00367E8974
MANRTDQPGSEHAPGTHNPRDCNLCRFLNHPAIAAQGRTLARYLIDHPLLVQRQQGTQSIRTAFVLLAAQLTNSAPNLPVSYGILRVNALGAGLDRSLLGLLPIPEPGTTRLEYAVRLCGIVQVAE